jgi:tripartite-type tricarboxylate transporter receptor subunit TctC
MSEVLGQTVLVELRPGAGGHIGATQVARQAKPDGYTILFAASSLASNVSLLNRGFEPRTELAAVAGVAAIPNLMVTSLDGPYKTANDVFAHARKDPGAITFGSSGLGTGSHLSGELTKVASGLEMRHIPYKGSGLVYQDLISGRVSVLFDAAASSLPQIQGGKVRALATTSKKRLPSLPNVPSLSEIFPGFEMVTWFGMFAPAGTPPEALAKLADATVKAVRSPEMQERLQLIAAEEIPGTPAGFKAYFEKDVAQWEDLVKRKKISAIEP